MPARFFVKLAYDGTAYHGWQIQNNALSVQEILQKTLEIILKQPIEICGCGRTDTGVHAREYYAHVDLEKEMQGIEYSVYHINALLPPDISIINIQKVNNDYHARFSAIKRTYKYYINPKRIPFNRGFEYHYSPNLDLELMNEACLALMEFKYFACFSKSNTQVNNFVCEISEALWTKDHDVLIFTISANRFLRNMVRAIVGTMIEIGLKKIDIHDLRKIILNGNRSDAGVSVPAKGLFLDKVIYPENMKIE